MISGEGVDGVRGRDARRNEWFVSGLCCLGGIVPLGRPGPDACILIHATPGSLLQNWPESHPAEHTQVPGAAFLGLVEALQQGEARGARQPALLLGATVLGRRRCFLRVGSYRMLQEQFKTESTLETKEKSSLLPDRGQIPP